MSTLVNYGTNGIQIVSPIPSGSGGAALNSNFKDIDDAVTTLQNAMTAANNMINTLTAAKAAKVAGAISGNLASLTGTGDLADSGISASDVGAAGSNSQVQYNSSGSFAGDGNFTWDTSDGILQIGSPADLDNFGLKVQNAGGGGYFQGDGGDDTTVEGYATNTGYSGSMLYIYTAVSLADAAEFFYIDCRVDDGDTQTFTVDGTGFANASAYGIIGGNAGWSGTIAPGTTFTAQGGIITNGSPPLYITITSPSEGATVPYLVTITFETNDTAGGSATLYVDDWRDDADSGTSPLETNLVGDGWDPGDTVTLTVVLDSDNSVTSSVSVTIEVE